MRRTRTAVNLEPAAPRPSSADRPLTVAYRLEDLVARRSLDRPLQHLLDAAVRAALNIVISGDAGSGKTTMLNALYASIPADERPERIVLGDTRGTEALRLLNVMAHGDGGALATVRTASVDGALPALAALAGAATPTASTRLAATTAGHAVDLIVHLERADDGARRVREVALPVLQGRHYGLSTLAGFEPGRRPGHGRFRHYPVSAHLARRLRAGGESIPSVFRADHFGTPTR